MIYISRYKLKEILVQNDNVLSQIKNGPVVIFIKSQNNSKKLKPIKLKYYKPFITARYRHFGIYIYS